MPKLTKRLDCLVQTYVQMDGQTDPNYRKTSFLKTLYFFRKSFCHGGIERTSANLQHCKNKTNWKKITHTKTNMEPFFHW